MHGCKSNERRWENCLFCVNLFSNVCITQKSRNVYLHFHRISRDCQSNMIEQLIIHHYHCYYERWEKCERDLPSFRQNSIFSMHLHALWLNETWMMTFKLRQNSDKTLAQPIPIKLWIFHHIAIVLVSLHSEWMHTDINNVDFGDNNTTRCAKYCQINGWKIRHQP